MFCDLSPFYIIIVLLANIRFIHSCTIYNITKSIFNYKYYLKILQKSKNYDHQLLLVNDHLLVLEFPRFISTLPNDFYEHRIHKHVDYCLNPRYLQILLHVIQKQQVCGVIFWKDEFLLCEFIPRILRIQVLQSIL